MRVCASEQANLRERNKVASTIIEEPVLPQEPRADDHHTQNVDHHPGGRVVSGFAAPGAEVCALARHQGRSSRKPIRQKKGEEGVQGGGEAEEACQAH